MSMIIDGTNGLTFNNTNYQAYLKWVADGNTPKETE